MEKQNSDFSDFFRNASDEEKKRVYTLVADKATKRQLEIIQENEMKKYKEVSDTSLLDDAYCEACGEMIVVQVNNTQLAKFEHDDWFCYCANKECPNHEGEGKFQAYPDWVVFE